MDTAGHLHKVHHLGVMLINKDNPLAMPSRGLNQLISLLRVHVLERDKVIDLLSRIRRFTHLLLLRQATNHNRFTKVDRVRHSVSLSMPKEELHRTRWQNDTRPSIVHLLHHKE